MPAKHDQGVSDEESKDIQARGKHSKHSVYKGGEGQTVKGGHS
jgi:hypothetical protein